MNPYLEEIKLIVGLATVTIALYKLIQLLPKEYIIPEILSVINLIFLIILYKYYKESKPKNPSNLIYEHLGYPDVKFAVYCLSKKIEGFFVKDESGNCDARKNIIIGIDRGGAILGGLLAKNLGVAVTTLAINYADDPPKTIPPEELRVTSIIAKKGLENISFESVTNILLVDDAIRAGNTMVAAKKFLRKILIKKNKSFLFVCDEKRDARADEIKINIACILYKQEERRQINLPEFCVYQTKIVDRWLLWDTTREEMKLKEKENDLFEKYYKLIPNELL